MLKPRQRQEGNPGLFRLASTPTRPIGGSRLELSDNEQECKGYCYGKVWAREPSPLWATLAGVAMPLQLR